MYLRSKFGRKMLIGRDVSRDAASTVWQLGFKITILELVRSLEYANATTSLICKLRDCFSLKRQNGNIQLG